MPTAARRMSPWDTIRLQLHVSLPQLAAGVVVPNRALFRWLVRSGQAVRATRFLQEMREKYGETVWTRFPFRRTLVAFGLPVVERLLKSDENAADPTLKRLAVSRFAPQSLVMSSGDPWIERRAFNECALDLERPLRHAQRFADLAAAETARLMHPPRTSLRWRDFGSLAKRLAQQVALGEADVDDAFAGHLAGTLAWSNSVLFRNWWSYYWFYRIVRRRLARARPRATSPCLIDEDMWLESRKAHSTICVQAQIAFWMFVLTDALELHTARTLALIAAHPDIQDRVRREILAAGALTPEAIDGLHCLEACLLEQMRLWTPVPLLLRRALQPMSLGDGLDVAKDDQIAFFAGFHHRDARAFGESVDRFAPPAVDGQCCYRANYAFSAHRQRCAGRTLILFLLKATLASLLARSRFELVGPAIDTDRIAYAYDHFAIQLRPVP